MAPLPGLPCNLKDATMKRPQQLMVLMLGLLVSSSVQADLVLTLGPEAQNLLPNASNQPVNILIETISGTPQLDGFQINAFIGDGFGGADEFAFASPAVRYKDGSTYVWDASGGAPTTGDRIASSVLQSSYLLDGVAISTPNGKLATVYVDTTGYDAGTFDLTLLGGDMASGNLKTSFLSGSDLGVVSFPNPGVLSISAIPEPSAVWALSCIGIIFAGNIACQRREKEVASREVVRTVEELLRYLPYCVSLSVATAEVVAELLPRAGRYHEAGSRSISRVRAAWCSNGGGTMGSMIRRLVLASCLLIGLLFGMLPQAPAACLTPTDRTSELTVSQTRQALSDPDGVTTTLTDLYDGLGTYSESLTIPGYSSASQVSQLVSSGASVELTAVASRESTEFGLTAASTVFELSFDLEYAADFVLSGNSELFLEAPFDVADSTASLVGPNLANSYSAYHDGMALNWSGNLTPGRYSLMLESHAAGSVIESSSASFTGQLQLVVNGDFNVDCQLTAEDIDQLSVAVAHGEYDSFYDLDQNMLLEPEDRRIWVEELRWTYFGDSDLSGDFSSADFVAVFVEGKYETQQPATWAQGDWDGDQLFDSSDFVEAFVGGGYEAGPRIRPMVVPEPSSGWLLLLGLLPMWRRRSIALRSRP